MKKLIFIYARKPCGLMGQKKKKKKQQKERFFWIEKERKERF